MRKVTSFFFLATVFCCTFEKVHWSVSGAVNVADILALLFLVAYL
ncbi:MAG: CvpA family protein, partial [Actinobacteria bacterium]|nr:CvpA family protein [Actinomycetota bacterium]